MRPNAKPINLTQAQKLYHECGSLRQVAMVFNVHHTNLMSRFRKFGIPLRTKSESMIGKSKVSNVPPPTGDYKDDGYRFCDKGYMVNRRTGQRVHREIAERVLGRKLKTDEVVHHIDSNILNNSNSNLLICSKSYHSWLHAKIVGGMIGKHYVGIAPTKEQQVFKWG